MFKKINFLLICTIVSISTMSCSKSDNDSGSNGDYRVTVSVSEGSTIENVNLNIYDKDTEDLNISIDLEGVKEWTRTFDKKEGKDGYFNANGIGANEESTMKVVITKGKEVIVQKNSKGKELSSYIYF